MALQRLFGDLFNLAQTEGKSPQEYIKDALDSYKEHNDVIKTLNELLAIEGVANLDRPDKSGEFLKFMS